MIYQIRAQGPRATAVDITMDDPPPTDSVPPPSERAQPFPPEVDDPSLRIGSPGLSDSIVVEPGSMILEQIEVPPGLDLVPFAPSRRHRRPRWSIPSCRTKPIEIRAPGPMDPWVL